MNTSTEAIKRLQEALATTQDATNIIDNLLATHNYQDVASLLAKAAQKLIEASTKLMESEDEAALDALDLAEDYIDEFYDILDGDLADD